ncbi:hypothetical protein [Dactylosporangium sp. NPDC051484]|uniref:hypothetical protein n=1 Tax=Dactylosporangium sp. NPDC051484 TaxID=3154942 RepID=UPI0034502B19
MLVCDVDAFAAWGGAVLSPDYELDPACDLSRANAVLYASDDEEFEAGLVRFGVNAVASTPDLLKPVVPQRFQVREGSPVHMAVRSRDPPDSPSETAGKIG